MGSGVSDGRRVGVGVSEGIEVAVLSTIFVRVIVMLGFTVGITVGALEFLQDIIIKDNSKRKTKIILFFILISYGNP